MGGGEGQDGPDPAAFLPMKMNLAKDSGGLAYSVADLNGAPVLAWNPERVTTDVNEAMTPEEPRGVERRKCIAWLGDTLAGGPLAEKEVQRLGGEAGYSQWTVRRAKDELQIQSVREGFTKGSRWLWQLPGAVDAHDTSHDLLSHLHTPTEEDAHLVSSRGCDETF